MKARRVEDPVNFVLVEELEYPTPVAETTPLGSSVRRRGLNRDRRILDDDENVYQVQAQWKAKGWFELRDRAEVIHSRHILFLGNEKCCDLFYRRRTQTIEAALACPWRREPTIVLQTALLIRSLYLC